MDGAWVGGTGGLEGHEENQGLFSYKLLGHSWAPHSCR
jgi:hypothetical protein